MKKRVWTVEEIKNKLENADNDKGGKWLYRAILAIYNNQTKTEQNTHATIENNGIGYNGFDAEIMTSFAKRIISHNKRAVYPQALSPKQRKVARSRIVKYTGQLVAIANGGI